MYKVLTIAGSDCSGGAGIQADIKTITAHGMYAMSAITSLTAQNTTGVYGVMDSTPEILGKQLDCIFNDIFPDAVKIGMVSDKELIKVIAEKLKEYKPKNIVLDTVMVATSGSPLLKPDSVNALVEELIPLATVITPNIPEAEVLGNCKIECEKDLKDTADADTNTVMASTASPFKFTRSVMDAIDPKYDSMTDFELVDELSRIGNVAVPNAIEEIRTAPIRHNTVCEVDQMPAVVKDFLQVR